MSDPVAIAPSRWVMRCLPLIPAGGCVLDLAAGEGRHTKALLDASYKVVAADRNVTALTAAFGDDPACTIRAINLEDGGEWQLGGGYRGIVVTNYLHRPLLPSIATALADGRVLIYETFMRGNEAFGKPSNPDFLLEPGELLAAFASLTVIAFEQGGVDEPRPAVTQRLAAVKGALELFGRERS